MLNLNIFRIEIKFGGNTVNSYLRANFMDSELEEILKPLDASLASLVNAGPVDSKRERIYAVNLHLHFYILYLDS